MKFSQLSVAYSVFDIITRSNNGEVVELYTIRLCLCLLNWLISLATLMLKVIPVFFGPLSPSEQQWFQGSILWGSFDSLTKAIHEFRHNVILNFAMAMGLIVLKAFHMLLIARLASIHAQAPTSSQIILNRPTAVLCLVLCADIWLAKWTWSLIGDVFQADDIFFLFFFEYIMLVLKVVFCAIRGAIFWYHVRDCEVHPEKNIEDWDMSIVSTFFLAHPASRAIVHLLLYAILPYSCSELYGTLAMLCGGELIYVKFTIALTLVSQSAKVLDPDKVLSFISKKELLYMDVTCPVCLDDMIAKSKGDLTPKKLACGHAFHDGCVRRWFKRSSKCPTCSRSVYKDKMQ